MSWYDGIGTGLGGLVDMFTGMPGGTTAAGASAVQSGAANSDTAQSVGKATGLTPFMRMLGMTPAAAAPEDRVAKPSELADLAAGKMPAQAGGSTNYTNKMADNKEVKGFRDADGKFQMPSVSNWGGTGTSAGNRQSDIDARDKGMKISAPEIYQPDLSKIPRTVVGQKSLGEATKNADGTYENVNGAGRFTETAYGSHTDDASWGLKTKTSADGKGSTSLGGGGYQAGAEYRTGYRAVAASDDHRYSADAEAGLVANAGLSGSYGIDSKNGAFATGGIGAKAGAYAQANANAKSKSVNVGGVDYDAGIGAHGEVFAGAKAGAGGTVGIGPDFVGAKGNIGAFVGAEAAGDIHGNLGPLGAKVGASGMVGAGIGADGDISYKDGKFHIGGKMFAALGYGGSLSADMTVDVGAIGKSAYNLGATGLDYAGKGLSAAGTGIYNAGAAGVDMAEKGISAAGKGIYNAGAAGVDMAEKGLSAAGTGIYNAGAAGVDLAERGLSSAGSAISSGASAVGGALSDGASAVMSW